MNPGLSGGLHNVIDGDLSKRTTCHLMRGDRETRRITSRCLPSSASDIPLRNARSSSFVLEGTCMDAGAVDWTKSSVKSFSISSILNTLMRSKYRRTIFSCEEGNLGASNLAPILSVYLCARAGWTDVSIAWRVAKASKLVSLYLIADTTHVHHSRA